MRSNARVRVILLCGIGLLACFPTEPCACPPATSLFRVFGRVLASDGQPAPNVRIAASAAIASDCTAQMWEDLETVPDFTDASGSFRSQLRSFSAPRARCLRLVAYAGTPATSDSVATPNLIVFFRIDRQSPDSLGLELRLP